MTTSGSSDFNLDMAEVAEEAFERCGLELRTGYDAKTARRSLNLLFAEWANRGLNLWTVEEINQRFLNSFLTKLFYLKIYNIKKSLN